jgi:hypothetical protein
VAPARGFSVLDVVRVLLGLLLLSSAMSWFVHGASLLWGWKPWWANVGAVVSWVVSNRPRRSDAPLTINRRAPCY